MLRPDWAALRDGGRPPVLSCAEPGVATRVAVPCVFHFRTPFSGAVTCVPGSGSLAVTLRTRVQQCPQLRIQIDSGALKDLGVGEVAAPTDSGGSQVAECCCLGRHRAACPRSGRLRRRAVDPEKTLARVCRKAGATVRCNAKLREMKVVVNR